jgi:diaminohydroxyphosphoribosylaminopyrimidine deaminase/5-amino-6-(5-phosphoribosylamino)uracil reductase
VAEGWHALAGGPHAEIQALRALGRPPGPDAILVVTLEPCSTHGRTGACTDAIRKAGIRRIVVGASDPNPAHAGRGLEILRQSGVAVTSGVLEDRCRDLNIVFNRWIQGGRPLVALKLALTLDGCLATRTGVSRWITGPEARAQVMRWRALFPSIAVGRGTVAADDPSLTVRGDGPEECPVRFILDSGLETAVQPKPPKVLSDSHVARTVFVCGDASEERRGRVLAAGARLWVCPGPGGRVDPAAWIQRMAEERICGVLVEPGPGLFRALVEARLADYLMVYTAPILLADPEAGRPVAGVPPRTLQEGLRLRDVRQETVGQDRLIRGWLDGWARNPTLPASALP